MNFGPPPDHSGEGRQFNKPDSQRISPAALLSQAGLVPTHRHHHWAGVDPAHGRQAGQDLRPLLWCGRLLPLESQLRVLCNLTGSVSPTWLELTALGWVACSLASRHAWGQKARRPLSPAPQARLDTAGWPQDWRPSRVLDVEWPARQSLDFLSSPGAPGLVPLLWAHPGGGCLIPPSSKSTWFSRGPTQPPSRDTVRRRPTLLVLSLQAAFPHWFGEGPPALRAGRLSDLGNLGYLRWRPHPRR